MTIIEMLNRLAEQAPDVCKPVAGTSRHIIGEYMFWDGLDGTFHAQLGSIAVFGRPALAWLADAIMGECEKRGWYWDIISYGDEYSSNVANVTVIRKTVAESLLAAFLAVMEGER